MTASRVQLFERLPDAGALRLRHAAWASSLRLPLGFDDEPRPGDLLHPLGIRPVQQFHYTNGKNASDTALIMDVMERLHRHRVDGICIASCDSDFVGLVGRVREHGPMVYGFGQYGASPAFVAAR